MPPLPCPHLREYALPLVRPREDLLRLVDEVLGQGWITPECAYGFNHIPVTYMIHLFRAVIERQVLLVPFTCLVRDGVDYLVKRANIVKG